MASIPLTPNDQEELNELLVVLRETPGVLENTSLRGGHGWRGLVLLLQGAPEKAGTYIEACLTGMTTNAQFAQVDDLMTFRNDNLNRDIMASEEAIHVMLGIASRAYDGSQLGSFLKVLTEKTVETVAMGWPSATAAKSVWAGLLRDYDLAQRSDLGDPSNAIHTLVEHIAGLETGWTEKDIPGYDQKVRQGLVDLLTLFIAAGGDIENPNASCGVKRTPLQELSVYHETPVDRSPLLMALLDCGAHWEKGIETNPLKALILTHPRVRASLLGQMTTCVQRFEAQVRM